MKSINQSLAGLEQTPQYSIGAGEPMTASMVIATVGII